jgi:hypothetical protein
MASLARTAWNERVVIRCEALSSWRRRRTPRQRSLAVHPCRALTACSVPSAPHIGLKPFELALKTATWCRSWVADPPPTEQ